MVDSWDGAVGGEPMSVDTSPAGLVSSLTAHCAATVVICTRATKLVLAGSPLTTMVDV